MKFDSGLTFKWVEGEEQKKNADRWFFYENGSIKLENYGYFGPTFLKIMDGIHNFKWRPTDTLLIGYPKTGTSWVQKVVWTMINDPNLDHPSSDLLNYFKVMFLEYDGFFGPEAFEDKELVEGIRKYCPTFDKELVVYKDLYEHVPNPRVMKTHFSLDHINPKVLDSCKVVYIMRNPKDVFVSYYYFAKTLSCLQFAGDMNDFATHFMEGSLPYGFLVHNYKKACEYRNHPNLYIMFYEDIRNNTLEELKKLDKFLGTNLNEQQFKNVIHKTSFWEMKNKDPFFFGANTFKEGGEYYRKGQVGDHKEKMSPELASKLNRHFKAAFEGYELPYDFTD